MVFSNLKYNYEDDPTYALKSATALYSQSQYFQALDFYQYVKKTDPNLIRENSLVSYAICLKKTGNLEEAFVQFQKCLQNCTETENIEKAKNELVKFELQNTLALNDNVTLNLPKNLLSFGFSPDGIGLQEDKTVLFSDFFIVYPEGKMSENNDFKKKIFSSKLNGLIDDSLISLFESPINGNDFNSSQPFCTADGNSLYFVRSIFEEYSPQRCHIYISHKKNDQWDDPKLLPKVNLDEYDSQSPYVGFLDDKKVLFFASNRPDGFGKMDIYYSVIEGDDYGEPVNLGNSVNTAEDEISPFFWGDELFFSSKGHLGLGGFDIFSSYWNGQTWDTVYNLGQKFNSFENDFSLIWDQKGKSGFFISNRPINNPTGKSSRNCFCNKIFRFEPKEPYIQLFIEVFKDEQPITGVKTEIIDLSVQSSENVISRSNSVDNLFSFSLKANKNYKIIVSKLGFQSEILTISTEDIFDDYSIKEKIILKNRSN